MNHKPPPTFAGPRLVDVVLQLIDEHQLNSMQVHRRFGVSKNWLYVTRADPSRSPRADTLQRIYEQLSGRPLL